MLVLYAVPVSNFSSTVRLLLRLKGVPFGETPPPDGYASAAYKAIVPTGSVPAITDGDFVLSESAVIAEYLDERFPEPRLLPAVDVEARARVRWLQRLHDARIEPPLRALFSHLAPAVRDQDHVEAMWAVLAVRLRELASARVQGRYLAGDTPTLADYAYPATLLMGERMAAALERTLPLPRSLMPWWSRLRAEPTVATELDGYGAVLDAWLERKLAQS